MNDEHWQLIKVLQDYYEKNGIAPMVRVLSKLTKFKLKHISGSDAGKLMVLSLNQKNPATTG